MLLGGMIICGLRPGPLLLQTSPDFVWAIIAALFLTNFILLISESPHGAFVRLYLATSLRTSLSDHFDRLHHWRLFNEFEHLRCWGHVPFRNIRVFHEKYEIPGAPMVIALVLGKMWETSLYQALNLSYGDITTFVTRPISAVLLGMAVVMTVFGNIQDHPDEESNA